MDRSLLARLIFVIVCGCTVSAEPDTVSSPLRVAQCRATCLEKFSPNDSTNGDSQCLQGPDCFMCWENCELLQSNFLVWGELCEEKEICFPGCQEACRFHTETSTNLQQTQPVIHTKGETVIHVNGAQAKWPQPKSMTKPIVYVVMRKSQSGPWRQIIQTIDLSTRVPFTNTNSTLRVLAVNSEGLVTIYSPDETNATNTSLKKRKKTINTEIKSITTEPSRWILQENSLIHQKVLVIGELSWEPKGPHGLYLVTWEVDGGGLKGNLYTDETCVTLSLWPNTLYHIQVELVSHRPTIPAVATSNSIKSEILDLDTSRAQIVSTESQQILTVLPSDDTVIELVKNQELINKNQEFFNKMQQTFTGNEQTFIETQQKINSLISSRVRHQFEVVAGCVTAVILFVIVLILSFVKKHAKSSKSAGMGPNGSESSSSHYTNFCRKGFQPILTMVTETESTTHPKKGSSVHPQQYKTSKQCNTHNQIQV